MESTLIAQLALSTLRRRQAQEVLAHLLNDLHRAEDLPSLMRSPSVTEATVFLYRQDRRSPFRQEHP
jgi:hypothetical protein